MTLWKSRFLRRCLLAAAIALGCLLLFGLFGMDCRIKILTGLPCPTCGMTRAWRSALSLDLSAAFSWHPLFWTVPILVLTVLFADLRKRWPKAIFWTALGLFLAVYLVRMLLLFPHTPPMDFYTEAVLPRFFDRF